MGRNKDGWHNRGITVVQQIEDAHLGALLPMILVPSRVFIPLYIGHDHGF